MFYGRHHDFANRYIISISLMTTDMFYGRYVHHDLSIRYIIAISLMTTDMLYGRHQDLGNRYWGDRRTYLWSLVTYLLCND
jgi:hypothetical protein